MKSSNDPQSESRAPEKDVLQVLFNQRWKILLMLLLISGLIAGVAIRILREPTFTSHAKILIRYVIERQDEPNEPSSVMEVEKAIMASHDVAMDVANAIGPDKLSSGTPAELAQRIASGLEITYRPGSNVMDLSHREGSPGLAREILETLIREYFDKHLEIHRSPETNVTELIKRADQARGRLRETEEKIRQLREQADSIPNGTEKFSDLNAGIRELERRRQMEAEEDRIYQINLEKVGIDLSLDPSRIPNIAIVQTPTTPFRPDGWGGNMVALGFAAFGLVAGLALAFVPDWVIQRRERSSR